MQRFPWNQAGEARRDLVLLPHYYRTGSRGAERQGDCPDVTQQRIVSWKSRSLGIPMGLLCCLLSLQSEGHG